MRVIIGAQLATTKFDETCHMPVCLNNASRTICSRFRIELYSSVKQILLLAIMTRKKISRKPFVIFAASCQQHPFLKVLVFLSMEACRDFHHRPVVSRCGSFHIVQDAIAIAHSKEDGKRRVREFAESQCKARNAKDASN